VIMLDSPPHEVGSNWQRTKPPKHQSFWVEVPPHPKRKKVLSVPVNVEEPTPEGIVQATVPIIKEEPDQEMVSALAVISNVSLFLKSSP